MAEVTGLGGLFFRARDPKMLTEWYQAHFGFGGSETIWRQQAGDTVFAPFRAETDYFPADKQFMINLRVDDLDAVLAKLAAAGVDAETRPEEWDHPDVGRFARIHDPEGNPVELWQPA
jgi:glyoxylase I family protein